MTLDLHRLAVVLRHANSLPPFEADSREQFYALKQAILQTYGQREERLDVQEILKRCWCGDGVHRVYGYDRHDCDGEVCRKCNGTAIYSHLWYTLERWTLGGLEFHRPLTKFMAAPGPVTIQGKIRHRKSKLAFAAWRVLLLLFRPQHYLYLDQFKMSLEQLSRFKAVLAYLLGFGRNKWRVEAVRYAEVQEASFLMKVQEVPVPF